MPFIAKTIRKGTVPNRTVFLILGTILLLAGCAHTRYIPLPEHHHRDSTHLSVYTRADSIREYVSDSMSIRFAKGVVPAAQRYTVPSGRYTSEVSSAGGNGIPDTVYIDRWHTAYRDRWHTLSHTDTITVTLRDTVTVPVPVEPPPDYSSRRRFLALSERARVWGKGFLIGGIGAILLAILAYIANRFYHYR